MPRSFSIRPFRNGDEFAIRDLHVAAILAVPETVYPRDKIAAWASGKTPDLYVKIQNETGEVFLVAVDPDDRPIGFCGYLEDDIRGLYVDPAWQGEGVGTALMQKAEAAIAAAGVRTSKVQAARSAYGFYERIGYVRTRIANHTMANGQQIEAAWYEKPIAK